MKILSTSLWHGKKRSDMLYIQHWLGYFHQGFMKCCLLKPFRLDGNFSCREGSNPIFYAIRLLLFEIQQHQLYSIRSLYLLLDHSRCFLCSFLYHVSRQRINLWYSPRRVQKRVSDQLLWAVSLLDRVVRNKLLILVVLLALPEAHYLIEEIEGSLSQCTTVWCLLRSRAMKD